MAAAAAQKYPFLSGIRHIPGGSVNAVLEWPLGVELPSHFRRGKWTLRKPSIGIYCHGMDEAGAGTATMGWRLADNGRPSLSLYDQVSICLSGFLFHPPQEGEAVERVRERARSQRRR